MLTLSKRLLILLAIIVVGILAVFEMGARWGVSLGFPANSDRIIARMQALADIARHLETLKKSGDPLPTQAAFEAYAGAFPAFSDWIPPFYFGKPDTQAAWFYLCLQGWSEINVSYGIGADDPRDNGWSFSGASCGFYKICAL